MSVKVPSKELSEWNEFFNVSKNWGIKNKFQEETGTTRNTLNWVLAKGSGYETTIKTIRQFVKKFKSQLQNA